jgi:outer membrane protein OmpA-like peptidoglycan-associated protein
MHRKLLIGGVVAAGLMVGLPPAFAQSQTTSISTMPVIEIVAALNSKGRLSMSGASFESNDHKLTAASASLIAKLADSLKQLPDAKVALVGHSDSTGDFAYNVELSARRAQSVIEALVSDHGIKRARLVGLGAGPIDPVSSNGSEDGRAQNRRVSFVVISEAQGGEKAVEAAQGFWMNDKVTGCAIWSADKPEEDERASWSGACHSGMAEGKGNLLFWDGKGVLARYDGAVSAGRTHGAGAIKFRNDEATGFDSYVGKFINGSPAGKGLLVSHSGYRFEGELLDGVNHGKGKLTTPDGWEIKGEIKDGKAVGEAFAYYEDANKDLYVGDIENSKRHGFGMLMMANDDAYVGEFVEGSPSGPGMFEAASGSQYLGIFASGSPNGVGTVIDVDGTSYQGKYVNGGAEGTILVTTKDGVQTIETWKDGSKIQ